jgi:hypothetical protein
MGAMFAFLFELIGSFIVEVVFAGIFGLFEYLLARSGKRFWMWMAGLALIGLVFWWRGFHIWPPYVFAGLMIGFLCYLQWESTRPKE